MSTLKVNNLQVGQDSTATNNLTWFQPGSPDGTIRLGSGNAGSATTKFTFDKDGNLTCVGDITANSIIAPIEGTLDDWIVHAGDTNTKFGFPAADTFSVETSGSERLYIKSDGKIGINTTTPNSALEVQGDGGVNDATITFTRLGSPSNGSVIGSNFYRIGTDSVAGIGAYRESAMDDAYLAFHTQPTGGNFTERLRITSDGKLGLGMNSDQQTALKGKLDIDASGIDAAGDTDDSNDYAIVIRNPSSTNTGNGIAFTNDSGANVGGAIIHIDKGTNNIGDLAFYTAASSNTPEERVRIHSGGQVTVGTPTSNTSDRFTIVDPGNAFMSLRSDAEADGNSQIIDFAVGTANRSSSNLVSTITASIPTGAGAGGTLKGYLAFSTNSGDNLSERLRITEGGDVVLGHNAANARLHIASGTSSAVGSATNPAFQIGNTSNYRFAIHTTNEQAIIANKNGDDGISFHTKTANSGSFGEALGIRSGGVVQIGGATANSADIDASNSKLTIKQSANQAEDGIYIERSGERRGHYIYVGGGLSQNDALCIRSQQLGTSTDVLAIDRGGDIVVGAGNIKMPNGKGIDFSNNTDHGETSTFTTLEDYEEGTFTPHFEIETRGASDSPVDGVQGRYVKVGNVVTCHYVIQLNGTPNQRSTSRAWEIHGFPYQAKDGNGSGQMGGNQRVTGYETATYGPDGHFVFRLFNHAVYGRLEFIEHNYNGTRNASPMMLDNAQVIGTITYQTDG